jgi:hypothetical protein
MICVSGFRTRHEAPQELQAPSFVVRAPESARSLSRRSRQRRKDTAG